MTPLLRDQAPAFADELKTLLVDKGRRDLAESVDALGIVQPCTCGDDFCASFYTVPPPVGAYGPDHQTLVLAPRHGAVNVDVAESRIVHVEVLHHAGLRAALARLTGRQLDPEVEAAAREKAREYVRTRGTLMPAPVIAERVRAAFAALEAFLDTVPAAQTGTVAWPGEWTVAEIADHVLETHRAALDEFRCVLAGQRPPGPPVPAGLQSRAPRLRPWGWLLRELQATHAELCALVGAVPADFSTAARVDVVMVIKVPGAAGTDVPVEWVEELDWKAYGIVLRLHAIDHMNQAKKVVAALTGTPATKRR